MAVITKRYYWGFKKYDTKTGKYQGQTDTNAYGETQDWRGKTVSKESRPLSGMSRKTYDD